MKGFIDLSFNDIKNIAPRIGPSIIKKENGNVVFSYKIKPLSVDIVAEGAQTEYKYGAKLSVSGDETSPRIDYEYVIDGEDGDVIGTESIAAKKISARVKFYDYGPIEKASATVSDWLDTCLVSVMRKEATLGKAFLNDAEKELFLNLDYIYFVRFPEFVRFCEKEEFKRARGSVTDGTALATAFDACLKEDMGIPGRINKARLKKELKRHAADGFDRAYYSDLCDKAVSGFYSFEEYYDKEKYERICAEISKLMEKAGYSGIYPCFTGNERYVNFGLAPHGIEIEIFVRFGIDGAKPKKYMGYTGSDMLFLPLLLSDEWDENLKVCVGGITDMLDGKNASEEFLKILSAFSGVKPHVTDKLYGTICIALALCLAVIIITGAATSEAGFAASLAASKFRAAAGLSSSCALLALGVYMSFFRGKKRRFLRRSKKETL